MITASQAARILKKSLTGDFKQKNGYVYKPFTDDFYLMVHFDRSKYRQIFYVRIAICSSLFIDIDKNNKFRYVKPPSTVHDLEGREINQISGLGFDSGNVPVQHERVVEFAETFAENYDKTVEPFFLSLIKSDYDKGNAEVINRLVEKHYPAFRCVDIGHMLHKWGFYDEAVWLYQCHEEMMEMYPHEMKQLIAAAKEKRFLSIDDLYD